MTKTSEVHRTGTHYSVPGVLAHSYDVTGSIPAHASFSIGSWNMSNPIIHAVTAGTPIVDGHSQLWLSSGANYTHNAFFEYPSSAVVSGSSNFTAWITPHGSQYNVTLDMFNWGDFGINLPSPPTVHEVSGEMMTFPSSFSKGSFYGGFNNGVASMQSSAEDWLAFDDDTITEKISPVMVYDVAANQLDSSTLPHTDNYYQYTPGGVMLQRTVGSYSDFSFVSSDGNTVGCKFSAAGESITQLHDFQGKIVVVTSGTDTPLRLVNKDCSLYASAAKPIDAEYEANQQELDSALLSPVEFEGNRFGLLNTKQGALDVFDATLERVSSFTLPGASRHIYLPWQYTGNALPTEVYVGGDSACLLMHPQGTCKGYIVNINEGTIQIVDTPNTYPGVGSNPVSLYYNTDTHEAVQLLTAENGNVILQKTLGTQVLWQVVKNNYNLVGRDVGLTLNMDSKGILSTMWSNMRDASGGEDLATAHLKAVDINTPEVWRGSSSDLGDILECGTDTGSTECVAIAGRNSSLIARVVDGVQSTLIGAKNSTTNFVIQIPGARRLLGSLIETAEERDAREYFEALQKQWEDDPSDMSRQLEELIGESGGVTLTNFNTDSSLAFDGSTAENMQVTARNYGAYGLLAIPGMAAPVLIKMAEGGTQLLLAAVNGTIQAIAAPPGTVFDGSPDTLDVSVVTGGGSGTGSHSGTGSGSGSSSSGSGSGSGSFPGGTDDSGGLGIAEMLVIIFGGLLCLCAAGYGIYRYCSGGSNTLLADGGKDNPHATTNPLHDATVAQDDDGVEMTGGGAHVTHDGDAAV